MRTLPDYLRETHIVGRRCHERMLDSEHFAVLRNAPFRWVGHSVLRAPYRMVRLSSVHSHVVACLSGRGRALLDGRMVAWNPGQVLLAPVGCHHAFEVDGAGPWEIAWVFFEDRENEPVLRRGRVELRQAECDDFSTLVRMLTREASGPAQPSSMEALVNLLDTATRRLAGVEQVDERLWRLWGRVEEDLSASWDVKALARLACVSEEHLRRLCHVHYQRSPVEHLTLLRMRRAATMLRSTGERLDEIARQVGYSSVYSFSAAFSRWAGIAPARFRRGGRQVPRAN